MATAIQILEVRRNTNTTIVDYDDTVVGDLIDSSSVECASATIYKWLIAKLSLVAGGIRKSTGGVESHEFQALKDQMDFYKGMYDFWKNECLEANGNNTSAFIKATPQSVGGVVTQDELDELTDI